MKLKTRYYLIDDSNEKFMGLGVLWLAEKTSETGSLLSASKELGISYCKALRMIKNAEKALGCDILDRKRGGSTREGSTLTPFAKQFFDLYKKFESEANSRCLEAFEDFKKELEKLS